MRKEEVKALDDILTLEDASTSFRKQDISGEILDSKYVTEDFRPPTRCPVYQNCQANCDWEEEGNEIFVPKTIFRVKITGFMTSSLKEFLNQSRIVSEWH